MFHAKDQPFSSILSGINLGGWGGGRGVGGRGGGCSKKSQVNSWNHHKNLRHVIKHLEQQNILPTHQNKQHLTTNYQIRMQNYLI